MLLSGLAQWSKTGTFPFFILECLSVVTHFTGIVIFAHSQVAPMAQPQTYGWRKAKHSLEICLHRCPREHKVHNNILLHFLTPFTFSFQGSLFSTSSLLSPSPHSFITLVFIHWGNKKLRIKFLILPVAKSTFLFMSEFLFVEMGESLLLLPKAIHCPLTWL